MNWLYWAIGTFFGLLAGWRASKAWHTKPADPPGVFRFVFETRDAGRTWFYEGQEVRCSPLSDQLQNAITAVAAGWSPEVPPERQRFLEAHGFDAGRALRNPPGMAEARAAAHHHGKARGQDTYRAGPPAHIPTDAKLFEGLKVTE